MIASPKWKRHFAEFKNPLHRFGVEQSKRLLQQAGLVPSAVVEVVEDDPIDSKEDLEKQIVSWVPHLKILKDPELLTGASIR